MDVNDKVIIVTGASHGIGEATARCLAERGARVVLAARSAAKLEALGRDLPDSLVLPTDMTDLAAVRAMVDGAAHHYGRVDGLINNAGQGYRATVEEINPEEYERLVRLNVTGPLVAMQAAIPFMRRQGGGSIVNVSSGTSLMKTPGLSAYSSTKRALNGLTLTAREELADAGIAVSLIYPYITDTEFHNNAVRAHLRTGHGPPADPAEYVAGMILTALEEGGAEYWAHDWMKGGR